MNINTDKILSKPESVKYLFETYQNDKTVVNGILFLNRYREQSKQEMLGNAHYLYEMNSSYGLSFLDTLLETAALNDAQLNEYKNDIVNYCNKHPKHTPAFETTLRNIDRLIENNNVMENIRDEVVVNMATNDIKRYCVFESGLDNSLDIIMYNINYSPETISELELLLRKIKLADTARVMSGFPNLITKSTEMITIIDIRLSGATLDLVTSIPEIIANKLCDGTVKLNNRQIASFITIYDKQISIITKLLKSCNKPELYPMYTSYLSKLADSKKKIENVNKPREPLSYSHENLADMQPDIVPYEEDAEDFFIDLEETMVNFIFSTDEVTDFKMLENLVKLNQRFNVLYEDGKIAKTMTKVSNKTRKVGIKAHDIVKKGEHIKASADKAFEPFINSVNMVVNKIKSADKKERTERIISGEYRFKLKTTIRRGIGLLAGFKLAKGVLLGGAPATAIILAIGTLTALALDNYLDVKTRKSIISDLEGELEIVNEKLDDVRSDSDRRKKYELMRIRRKLEKDIERIKYRLD